MIHVAYVGVPNHTVVNGKPRHARCEADDCWARPGWVVTKITTRGWLERTETFKLCRHHAELVTGRHGATSLMANARAVG